MSGFDGAMFAYRLLMHLLSVQVSLLGVLQRLPGSLLSREMILLAVLLRGSAVRVGRLVVQLGGALMVFVMGSVVIASRH